MFHSVVNKLHVPTHFGINIAFCNEIKTSVFVIKSAHFVIPITFCNKIPDEFYNKFLPHFVIKELSHFAIIKELSHFTFISVVFCNKVS